MFEALILLAAALVSAAVVSLVVVRDGIHHTRFERELARRRALFRALAGAVGATLASLGPAVSAIATGVRAAADFAEAQARTEAIFAASRNWFSVGDESAPAPPMKPGDVWHTDHGTFRMGADGSLLRAVAAGQHIGYVLDDLAEVDGASGFIGPIAEWPAFDPAEFTDGVRFVNCWFLPPRSRWERELDLVRDRVIAAANLKADQVIARLEADSWMDRARLEADSNG